MASTAAAAAAKADEFVFSSPSKEATKARKDNRRSTASPSTLDMLMRDLYEDDSEMEVGGSWQAKEGGDWDGEGEGCSCSHVTSGRSLMTVHPCMPAMGGRTTSGLHRPGGHWRGVIRMGGRVHLCRGGWDLAREGEGRGGGIDFGGEGGGGRAMVRCIVGAIVG